MTKDEIIITVIEAYNSSSPKGNWYIDLSKVNIDKLLQIDKEICFLSPNSTKALKNGKTGFINGNYNMNGVYDYWRGKDITNLFDLGTSKENEET